MLDKLRRDHVGTEKLHVFVHIMIYHHVCPDTSHGNYPVSQSGQKCVVFLKQCLQ